MRWLVTGEAAAGAATVRLITAWATITDFDTNAGSVLTWNTKWPVFLQAAIMLDGHPNYTPAIHLALQDVTRRGLALSAAYTNDNNWGGWGLTLEIASAGFIGDWERFDRALIRWRTLFDVAVVGNIPVYEIYRQGSKSVKFPDRLPAETELKICESLNLQRAAQGLRLASEPSRLRLCLSLYLRCMLNWLLRSAPATSPGG